MNKDELLPFPKEIDEIFKFISPFLNDEELWKGRKLSHIPSRFKHQEKIPINDPNFNRYVFLRACNQINESINKLWATAELHYHMKNGSNRLCGKFSPQFLQTSTLPTLYYAEVSAIIAIMCIFGICSIVDKPDRGNIKFLNLIRSSKGFILPSRGEYLKKVFGTNVRGWHNQVIFMYEQFLTKGIKLPHIEISKIKDLKNERNYFHYDLLGKPTMNGAYGEKKYFDHLPHVLNTIETSLNVIHRVKSPLKNHCDVRFKALKSGIDKKLGV